MSELDDLKKEIADLKQRLDPPPQEPSTYRPFDYTQGMSMPRSAMQAMIDAVPSSLMANLRADAQKPNPVTGNITKPEEPPKVIGKNGWIDARPLTPPDGIGLVDQIAEGFEKRERRGR